MRVTHQPGFVLHTRPYSESSLLVNTFSSDHGRLTLLAKGARRLKSPYRGLLQPFQPLSLGWSGKRGLPVLTACEVRAAALLLTGHARVCGFYLNELLFRLLHEHDPHQLLYQSYELALCALAEEQDREPVLRRFEKLLLRELGYALALETDAASGLPIAPASRYRYLPQRGAVDAGDDRSGQTVSGATLLALAGDDLQEQQALRESKILMRRMIGYHLGGKPLHTRRLFARK